MKYVALLSGGKDSCYNLLHCAHNGHELVAAASLRPELGKDEIDSYMYQTVGQDAIELVAEALDIPLYRGTIKGTAVNMGTEYGARQATKSAAVRGDETEDLFELLSSVKDKHPDVQGVSAGAILSNYQRVRVEHVCRRLSLTPLCYLWQRDQRELLSEMIQAGLEAVLIKVAGIGLTTKHLGRTLSQMQPTLLKLNDLYELHPCGEGGEYETLTLDCPLFKRRISLEEVEIVIHSDKDFATVAYLRIKIAKLVPKDEAFVQMLPVPPLLEDEFVEMQMAADEPAGTIPSLASGKFRPAQLSDSYPNSKRCGRWVTIGNVQRSVSNPDSAIDIHEEVRECFHIIQAHLQKYGLDFSHIANINIFLSSMDLFSRVNETYAMFFGSAPPARACVAADLPSPIHVRLECIAYAEESERDRAVLHVQGLSYWAPANIGPYSQAVVIKEQRMFLSGQIGLIPSNLTLPSPQALSTETALSCQHVKRVARALCEPGRWRSHCQLALYWLQSATDVPVVRHATAKLEDTSSPTLYVVVASLPKGALVEKQVLLHTGRFEVPDEEGELQMQSFSPLFQTGDISGQDGAGYWELSRFPVGSSSCAILCVRGLLDKSTIDAHLPGILSKRVVSVRLFYVPSESSPPVPSFVQDEELPLTLISARFISSRCSDNWDYAICLISE
ncbi:unnamed protein product [Somion occarium]|uniref:Diphthine--ammonia ligase n=1 Tax=Somion occarium TaxID=3059160 RepID=A0ABP1D1S6_9APHY